MISKIIYRLFKKVFLKEFYKDQSFNSGHRNMTRVFVDSNGVEYYTFTDDLDLPINRWKEIEKIVLMLKHCMTDETIDLFCDAMEKALNSGKKVELAKIGYLIEEMRRRKNILMDTDLMFDLIAYKLIRKDENPAEVDKVIHKQKIEQFKKDSVGGLYDFFYNAGIIQYMPYLESLKGDFEDIAIRTKTELRAAEIYMKGYITEQK